MRLHWFEGLPFQKLTAPHLPDEFTLIDDHLAA
jgi:hypothetical protein